MAKRSLAHTAQVIDYLSVRAPQSAKSSHLAKLPNVAQARRRDGVVPGSRGATPILSASVPDSVGI